MPKKKKVADVEEFVSAPIREQAICDTLETNYMPYAMSVIVSRAIPEIDGLKPAHRKLLYTMYRMGLLTGKLIKSANVVGQTMQLNPHGDAAIYETMVRLTRGNEALLHPLVESQGNFGKQYSRDMAYAASRYTEVKLEPICQELFGDINKNTVPFVDNYDGTLKEPQLLPVAFPHILVNPNQGIAVGMASNICSFNLREVCEATIELLKHPKADIIDIMPAPDFSMGAQLLYNRAEMEELYKTGKGSFKLRAKYNYDKANNCIEVTEIPYTTTSEAIIGKVLELIKANKLREIADARDETGLDGFKITFDLKRGTDPDALMLKLYKLTPLEDSFSANFNVLIHNRPVVLGVRELIGEWIDFRVGCIANALRFDIDKKSARLHLLNGLKKILLDIDKAIKIIRLTERDDDVVPNLMDGFGIDKIQAEYVAEIKLRNLNKEYILNKTDEISKLIEDIADMQATLDSEKAIKKIIANQLKDISKKYGQDRKTELVNDEHVEVYVVEDTIEDTPVTLYFTRDNYLKKVITANLRTSGDHKLKENDEIIQTIETTNVSDILLFSNLGNCYKLKTYNVNECKVSMMGEYVPALVEAEPNERILYIVVTKDYVGDMLFAFENGKMAKVPLNAYETKTNRKKLINAFSVKSPCCGIVYLPNPLDIVCNADNNKVLCVNSDVIPLKTTKSTQGVQVLTIRKKGAKMIGMTLAENTDLKDIKHYTTKNIPAAGSFLRKEDALEKQMSLLDEE